MVIERIPEVRTSRLDQVIRVRLSGPVNSHTIPFFQPRLEGECSENGITLALDLGAADYVDSDGVRWLQSLQAGLAERGGELRLSVRERSPVERTLNLLQLDRTFPIERYRDDTPGRNAVVER